MTQQNPNNELSNLSVRNRTALSAPSLNVQPFELAGVCVHWPLPVVWLDQSSRPPVPKKKRTQALHMH